MVSIVLLLSVLFMPWWLSVILTLGAMVYFPIFWEAVPLFLLSDLLYGTELAGLFNITFISSILSVLTLICLEILKKRLKFYPNKKDDHSYI